MTEGNKWLLILVLLVVAGFIALGSGMLDAPLGMTTQAASKVTLAIGQVQQAPVHNDAAYSVVSTPRIPVKHLNVILAAYHSPMTGMGQLIYDLGRKYQVSSDYALAFWLHESTLGTQGEATVTFSPGNERCLQDRPCIDRDRGGYAQMQNWQDGIAHWYMLIHFGYVQGQITRSIVGHVCTTIDQIIPVYAPSRDHNNEQAYIAALKYAVDHWRAGEVVL